jgi:MscS family membrane protein
MTAADKSLETTTASAAEAPSPIDSIASEMGGTSSNIPVNPAESHIDVPQLVDLLPTQVQPFWEVIQRIPLLESLIIVIIFWALAYLIRKYAIELIEKIAGRTESDVDDLIINELRGPIFSSVIWIGLLIGAASAGLDENWSRFLNRLILSAIVLIWLRACFSLSSLVFTEMSRDTKRFKKIDIRTEPLLIIVSKLLTLLVVSYILLDIWGINPVGLLASAGIVGIAVGFAAKDTLANLFSGVFILADRPYKLGDYVNLDTGERGKVTHIGIRSTRILTRDDIEVTVPNAVIGNTKVVNESGGPYQKMRIRLDTQCAYESDLDEVCALFQAILEEEVDLCKYPAPRVRVRGFADSGINIQLLGWIEKPEDRGRITHTLYIKVHTKMREAGIEIPYPKRDIHMIS